MAWNNRICLKHLGSSRVAASNYGMTTLFWEHKWETNHTLRELATQDIPADLSDAILAELWDSEYGWKWDEFPII